MNQQMVELIQLFLQRSYLVNRKLEEQALHHLIFVILKGMEYSLLMKPVYSHFLQFLSILDFDLQFQLDQLAYFLQKSEHWLKYQIVLLFLALFCLFMLIDFVVGI